jgi:hypothetical protein
MSPRPEEALRILPADKVEEVAQFAERLAAKHQSAPNRFLEISWKGAAKNLRDDYASGVDMAHEALRLRRQSN